MSEGGSEGPGYSLEEEDWRVVSLGGYGQQRLLFCKGHVCNFIGVVEPDDLLGLHSAVVPDIYVRAFGSLSRCDKSVFLSDAETGDISGMM